MANDPSPAAAIVPLASEECAALLERHRLCTLSVVDEGHPYAVPLFYGFDGSTMYLGLSEGRKTRALDANPRLCLTVTEVGPGDAWSAVQVTGQARWLEAQEREAAMQVLLRHNRRVRESQDAPAQGGAEPPSPQRRHAGGRILVVADAVITGRARR